MKLARWWAVTGAVGLGVSMAAMTGLPAAAAPHPGPASHRMALRGSVAPARERSRPAGAVASSSQVSFDLLLSLRNTAAAQAFVQQVSSPGWPRRRRGSARKGSVSGPSPGTGCT
jgi:hypothetical protein